MLKLKLKKINITFTIIIVAILITICSYIFVLLNVRNDLNEQTQIYISNITEELGRFVNLKIEERFKTLENYGYLFLYSSEEADWWSEYLDEYAAKENMKSIEVLAYSEEYLDNGDKTITSETDADGEKCICMYVPVIVNDKQCIVKGIYDAEVFGKLVSGDMLGISKNTFVINRSGEIVAGAADGYKLENIFANNTKYVSTLKNHISSRESGYITYSSGNLKRYICYSNIEFNDWYVFSIVSSNSVEENYDEVNARGIFLSVVLILFIIILVFYIGYFNHKYSYYKKVVEEKMNNDSEIIEEKELED